MPARPTLTASLIVLTFVLVAVSFIDPPYPRQLKLQHAPTIAILLALAAASWLGIMGRGAAICILAFLWLHLIGARWIYSFVPYDDWARAIFGTSISDVTGWERNHYDRLVHFGSGLLVVPAAEMLQRYGGMNQSGAAIQAVAMVLAVGAGYEILEWLIAVTLSPQSAEAYNGQQGDVWDPQKDLALAFCGSLITAVFVARVKFTANNQS